MKKLCIILVLVSVTGIAFGQRKKTKKPKDQVEGNVTISPDTTQPRTVTITAEFKPTLKTSSKINFSAATPSPDTARPSLSYNVPAQNLFFAYQSQPLKPLAENIDTAIHWRNDNFIKLGYGNYTTPFVQTGLSFGDGVNSVVNVHGKYTSSNGQQLSQDFSKLNIEALGIFSDSSNANEWSGRLFLKTSTQYQYGYQPDTLKFTKDELRQQFTTFGGKVGVRNKKDNDAGISYSPSMSLNLFNDNKGGKESNFIVDAPFSKSFGKIFAFNLGLTADITSYKSDSGTVNNNLYYLTPAVQFNTPNFRLVAGVKPAWDNGVFSMLPNVWAEAKIKDEKFILQAGWIGYFNKTTYQSLAEMNPWLNQPHSFLNTRITEQYAGFKGSAGDHFTYNAKVSYLQFSNQPLFVNDTVTGKSFDVINESQMKDIRIHGEIGYTVQEKLSILAGASYNQYSNLQDNAEAWGLLPLEINGSLRWEVLKDVWVKSDVFFWDGAQYRNKQLQAQKLKPAIDLNAGLEFKIIHNLNFWTQFNNVLNNQYQRWHQYPVLGFNVLLGVVYSF
ncbi:MAG TPA: hypothetical protein VG738_02560 [Chitinophagaceae bacterium]|nr:hypothetical protein [Chitinophagaceae bacterium]